MIILQYSDLWIFWKQYFFFFFNVFYLLIIQISSYLHCLYASIKQTTWIFNLLHFLFVVDFISCMSIPWKQQKIKPTQIWLFYSIVHIKVIVPVLWDRQLYWKVCSSSPNNLHSSMYNHDIFPHTEYNLHYSFTCHPSTNSDAWI